MQSFLTLQTAGLVQHGTPLSLFAPSTQVYATVGITDAVTTVKSLTGSPLDGFDATQLQSVWHWRFSTNEACH